MMQATVFDSIGHFATQIQHWVETIAESLWVYPAMLFLAALDQFVPPIPSDSILISLAVASRAVGRPNLFLLMLFAMTGAFIGNLLCYLIGRRIGTDRFKRFRQGRGLRAITAARVAIEKRGAVYIIASRFIPIARIAIIMTVGAVHYPLKHFLWASAASVVLWSANAVVIGAVAGNLFENYPLAGIGIGVVSGTVIGMLIDRVVTWFMNRK